MLIYKNWLFFKRNSLNIILFFDFAFLIIYSIQIYKSRRKLTLFWKIGGKFWALYLYLFWVRIKWKRWSLVMKIFSIDHTKSKNLGSFSIRSSSFLQTVSRHRRILDFVLTRSLYLKQALFNQRSLLVYFMFHQTVAVF